MLRKKILSAIFFSTCFGLLVNSLTIAQTTTIAPGNWSTGTNWSSGVPSSGSTATVNHAMTVTTNISAGGTYNINQPIKDLSGNTAYTLNVGGVLNMNAQGTNVFEGALNVNNGGFLTIEMGDTLIVGDNSNFANNSRVEVKAGGVLIVVGDLKNDNNSEDIKVDGTIIVLGNFKGWNGSKITGTGSIQTTGSLTYQGSGQTFDSTTPCNSGPCGSSQFCAVNTVSSSQTICAGAAPSGLTANALAGYTYQWQKSTTSFYSGFNDITSSGTSQNYSSGVLNQTTYYRRKVSNGTTCTVYSLPVTITVNPQTVSVTISANTGVTICSGTTVNFTAAPGATESISPSYQWKVNGSNVGTGSTYSTSGLTNGQVVTCVMTSNTGCASPSSVTSNSLTMSVNAANTWIGNTSNSWTTGSNWCGGSIPTSSTNVTIPAGTVYAPLVSSSVNVRNVTINSSARLNVGSAGTLNIYGNFTNNGDYYDAGTTVFTGPSGQSINGSADSLNNLTISNGSGVTLNAITYVKKYLTLTTGTLTTNNNLTVDIYTGAILGTGSGAITGNVTVTRTIWNDNWHYISSPLNNKTVADWNVIVPIKFGANANLYSYDEPNLSPSKDIGWTAIGSTAVSLIGMRGYALYFPRWIYKTIFTMTGQYVHNQTYSNVALSNTSSGTPAADGWNLVGNPYPSEIDWDAASGWTKTGLDNTVYYYDKPNNRYASYTGGATPASTNGGTRYIPCMQGFFVKVTNPGTGTLAMTKNVRSSVNNRDNWRGAEQPILRLTATVNNTYSDETVVRMLDEATEEFDSQYDAYKLANSGSTPNLSTMLLNTDFSINSIPSSTIEKIIPVKLVGGIAGTYTLTASITGFGDDVTWELEDKLLGVRQDLSVNQIYTVELAAGDTSSRFYLHYKNIHQAAVVTSTAMGGENEDLSITAYQQQVTVDFQTPLSNTANVAVYDLAGNALVNMQNASTSSGKIQVHLPFASTGMYLVKVESGTRNKVQRVYLTK